MDNWLKTESLKRKTEDICGKKKKTPGQFI